jgi:hypothetical protein
VLSHPLPTYERSGKLHVNQARQLFARSVALVLIPALVQLPVPQSSHAFEFEPTIPILEQESPSKNFPETSTLPQEASSKKPETTIDFLSNDQSLTQSTSEKGSVTLKKSEATKKKKKKPSKKPILDRTAPVQNVPEVVILGGGCFLDKCKTVTGIAERQKFENVEVGETVSVTAKFKGAKRIYGPETKGVLELWVDDQKIKSTTIYQSEEWTQVQVEATAEVAGQLSARFISKDGLPNWKDILSTFSSHDEVKAIRHSLIERVTNEMSNASGRLEQLISDRQAGVDELLNTIEVIKAAGSEKLDQIRAILSKFKKFLSDNPNVNNGLTNRTKQLLPYYTALFPALSGEVSRALTYYSITFQNYLRTRFTSGYDNELNYVRVLQNFSIRVKQSINPFFSGPDVLTKLMKLEAKFPMKAESPVTPLPPSAQVSFVTLNNVIEILKPFAEEIDDFNSMMSAPDDGVIVLEPVQVQEPVTYTFNYPAINISDLKVNFELVEGANLFRITDSNDVVVDLRKIEQLKNTIPQAPVAQDDHYSVEEGKTLRVTLTDDTTLSFESESGDYIGQGKTFSATPEDGIITTSRNYDHGITISYQPHSDEPIWWTLDLAAPFDEQLEPGTYKGATRFPFQDSNDPGLDFSGSGRGCNTSTGEFTINSVSYDTDGGVQSLSADFTQYCGASSSSLRGHVTIDNTSSALDNDLHEGTDDLLAVLIEPPKNGAVNFTLDGSFEYTPREGFTGEDQFTYKVNDGNLESELATVRIDVTPAPPPQVVATHTLLINDGLTLEELDDGSYQMTENGTIHTQDPNGVIRLNDGTRLLIGVQIVYNRTYDANGNVKENASNRNLFLIVQKPDGSTSTISFEKVGSSNTLRVTRLRNFRSGVSHSEQVMDYDARSIHSEFEGDFQPQEFRQTSDIYFTQDLSELVRIVIADGTVSNTYFNDFETIWKNNPKHNFVKWTYFGGNLSSIQHFSDTTSYYIFADGGLDVTQADFRSLSSRTKEGVLSLLTDDYLIQYQANVTADDGTYFTLANINVDSFTLVQGLQVLKTETSESGITTLTVRQSNGTDKVYEVTIDNQGILSLTLIPRVVATQNLLINDGLTVEYFDDGRYTVTIDGETFGSNVDGFVIADGETKLQVNFDENGNIKDLTVSSAFGGDFYAILTFEPDIASEVLRVAQIKRVQPGVSEGLEIRDYTNQVRHTEFLSLADGYEQTIDDYFTLPLEQISTLVIDDGQVIDTYWQRFDDELKYDPAHQFVTFANHDDVLRHFAGSSEGDDKVHIFARGSLDISIEDLSVIQNRTRDSFLNLVQNDWVVSTPIYAEVTADDGTTFELGHVRISEIVFEDEFENDWVTTISENGRVILTVPQPDGTDKVYEVLIDENGDISLKLKSIPVPQNDHYTIEEGHVLNVSLADDTTLSFVSEPGDYIGGGQTFSATREDGSITTTVLGSGNGIRIRFNSDGDVGTWWTLSLSAPSGEPLTAGTYKGATRFPFQDSDAPGLDFSGSGRGCNQLTGEFTINSVSYDSAGEVQGLSADFTQHCEGGPSSLTGHVTIDNTSSVLDNDTEETQFLRVILVDLPQNGTVTLNEDGSFDYTPNEGFTGEDLFTYKVSDGNLESEPATVRIDVTPAPPPPQVVATHTLALNGGMGATLFDDRSYAVTAGGETFESDQDGVVTLADGTNLKINFDGSGGIPDLRVLLSDGEESIVTFEEDPDTSSLRVTRLQNFNTGVANSQQVMDYDTRSIHSDLSDDLDPQEFHQVSDIYFTQDLRELVNIVIANGTVTNTYFIDFETIWKLDPTHNFVKWTYFSEDLAEIRHFSDTTSYYVFARGEVDVAQEDVTTIESRTADGFRALLDDDHLIPWQNMITADDGTFFTTANMGVFSFIFGSDETLSSIRTKTDEDGTVTLTFPQADGSEKVYEVKIDDQSVVSLELVVDQVILPEAVQDIVTNEAMYRDWSFMRNINRPYVFTEAQEFEIVSAQLTSEGIYEVKTTFRTNELPWVIRRNEAIYRVQLDANGLAEVLDIKFYDIRKKEEAFLITPHESHETRVRDFDYSLEQSGGVIVTSSNAQRGFDFPTITITGHHHEEVTVYFSDTQIRTREVGSMTRVEDRDLTETVDWTLNYDERGRYPISYEEKEIRGNGDRIDQQSHTTVAYQAEGIPLSREIDVTYFSYNDDGRLSVATQFIEQYDWIEKKEVFVLVREEKIQQGYKYEGPQGALSRIYETARVEENEKLILESVRAKDFIYDFELEIRYAVNDLWMVESTQVFDVEGNLIPELTAEGKVYPNDVADRYLKLIQPDPTDSAAFEALKVVLIQKIGEAFDEIKDELGNLLDAHRSTSTQLGIIRTDLISLNIRLLADINRISLVLSLLPLRGFDASQIQEIVADFRHLLDEVKEAFASVPTYFDMFQTQIFEPLSHQSENIVAHSNALQEYASQVRDASTLEELKRLEALFSVRDELPEPPVSPDELSEFDPRPILELTIKKVEDFDVPSIESMPSGSINDFDGYVVDYGVIAQNLSPTHLIEESQQVPLPSNEIRSHYQIGAFTLLDPLSLEKQKEAIEKIISYSEPQEKLTLTSGVNQVRENRSISDRRLSDELLKLQVLESQTVETGFAVSASIPIE